MKYKINLKKAFILSVLGGSLFTTSCIDNIENTNPKKVTELTPEDTKYQLANVQYNFAFRYMQIDRRENPSNVLVQHAVQTQYADVSSYEFEPDAGDQYSSLWLGKLNNLRAIINSAEAAKDALSKEDYNYIKGIALAHMVFGIQNMTDHFGPIPYTDAFKADVSSEFFAPDYQSQEAVYSGLNNQLDEAIASLEIAGSTNLYGSVDKIYKGDAAQWLKFAYSLKLRLAARTLDRNEAASLKTINSLKGKAFTSNTDNAIYPFGEDNRQPIADNFRGRNDYAVSETLVETLSGLSDPRLALYAEKTQKFNEEGEAVFLDKDGKETTEAKTGETENVKVMVYKGGINGATNNVDKVSQLAENLRNDRSLGATLIQHAEVEFIFAEAAARSGNQAMAADHYANAIGASLNKWGVSSADSTAYAANVKWDNTKSYQEQIGTQKWIALYTQASEAWTEWRRLDFPKLKAVANAGTPNAPVRITFPSNETSANPVGYANGVKLLGGVDNTQTKLWWDVK